MSPEGDREASGEDAGEAGAGNDAPAVRVRGIYATALTELLRGEFAVVQASAPIRERFDAAFPARPADAAVETTDDRLGVGVVGGAAVGAVADRLRSVSRDTLAWAAAAPRGAVFRGVVTDTLGGGAVVDLGDGEGYLPYDRAEGYVDEGDFRRVQVVAPEPPWSDDRPLLDTDLRVQSGLVTLRRGATGGGGDETARLAELLPVDAPEGWVPDWAPAADDADLDALADALAGVGERAEELMAAVAGAAADPDEAPVRLYDGEATRWVRFGREARFGLDGHRRDVTPTMPGHHRVKAAHEDASAAVDLVEAVCPDAGDGASGDLGFPFEAVAEQFGPREGDRVAIAHGKPDGRVLVLGRAAVTGREADGTVTLRREMHPGGTYDALGVERHEGDVAVTKVREGRWWYPTVYRGADGQRRGTYVNVCTPVEVFPDAVRYVDLHVDVVKHADGRVERVDDDELDAAVAAGDVPGNLAEKARGVAAALEDAL